MSAPLRIGTRDSELAVWQATQVQQLLKNYGSDSELVFIKSEGDLDLTTPLYDLGIQGIFTRSLDIALLQNKIDLAVHSMKDVPTRLAKGIRQAAVLERGPYRDVLVSKTTVNALHNRRLVVATSSIRRKAQWLHRHPSDDIQSLRGNVNTRLKKLRNENWDAAIFALAGLERINLLPRESVVLDWMLPAPAQGAIVVVCREDDDAAFEQSRPLNHRETEMCTQIEREFLRELLGGCSTPISALAVANEGQIHFQGNVFSPDGTMKAEIELTRPIEDAAKLGQEAGKSILQKGGSEIMSLLTKETRL
jgi:hydroxymethylbilane synthase